MVRAFLAGLDDLLGIKKRALSPHELRMRIDGALQKRAVISLQQDIDRDKNRWPHEPIRITPNLTDEARRKLLAESERQGITVAEVLRRAINGEREKTEGQG